MLEQLFNDLLICLFLLESCSYIYFINGSASNQHANESLQVSMVKINVVCMWIHTKEMLKQQSNKARY